MAKKSARKTRAEDVPMTGRQIANTMAKNKTKSVAKKRFAKTAKKSAKKSKRG